MSTHTPAALRQRRALATETRHLRSLRLGLWIALALVAVVGLALWTHLQAEQIRGAQIEACERGNILRHEISENNLIVRAFLIQAAESAESAARNGTPKLTIGRTDTAREYTRLADHLRPTPPIDCPAAIRS